MSENTMFVPFENLKYNTTHSKSQDVYCDKGASYAYIIYVIKYNFYETLRTDQNLVV